MNEEEKTQTVAETVKTEEKEEKKELTFDEILSTNNYQSEFDKRVSKALETAKTKWQQEAEAEKTEAEKLAKMDAEQKANYELKKAIAENQKLQKQLNADSLYKQASSIMNEKEIPTSYLDLFDFTNESAETIKNKIDKIDALRNKDRESYLNNKLKEDGYREEKEGNKKEDPYIKGFMDAFK